MPSIPDFPNDVPVVCQGPAFVPRALNYPHLRPGLFFDPAMFRWSAFRDRLEAGNADIRRMPRDAFVCTGSVCESEGLRSFAPIMIPKPSTVESIDAVGLDAATEGARVNETTPVVVASPVKIEAEWRFFIVDREVVGCSEYRRGVVYRLKGRYLFSDGFAAESASMLGASRHLLPQISRATENRIGIVEANCFNASRFYAAVIDRVLQAVNTNYVWLGSSVVDLKKLAFGQHWHIPWPPGMKRQ